MTEIWDYGKLGNDADQWAIYDNDDNTIGLSYHGEHRAKIMAAAPEMLAALKDCENWFGESEGGPDTGIDSILVDLRAIIAKAEGGA